VGSPPKIESDFFLISFDEKVDLQSLKERDMRYFFIGYQCEVIISYKALCIDEQKSQCYGNFLYTGERCLSKKEIHGIIEEIVLSRDFYKGYVSGPGSIETNPVILSYVEMSEEQYQVYQKD
jgi:hypothetical protein